MAYQEDFGSGVPGVADTPLKKPLEHTKIGVDKRVPVARGVFMRFPLALEAIAKVSKFGSIKYNSPLESLGYLKVPGAFLTYTDALGRHLLKEQTEGSINDQDGGVLHAAQVAWCALARLEALLRNDGLRTDWNLFSEPHYEDRSPK